ncbi:mitochondrial Homoaconitase [Dimargaris xerosporica]|nr:mitochondrial Homoaconitase [Dimargaris xerosporica]
MLFPVYLHVLLLPLLSLLAIVHMVPTWPLDTILSRKWLLDPAALQPKAVEPKAPAVSVIYKLPLKVLADVYDHLDEPSRGQLKLTNRWVNSAISIIQQQHLHKFLDTISAVDYYGEPWPLTRLHSVDYVSTVLSFVQYEMLQFIELLEEAHYQATALIAWSRAIEDQDGPFHITPDVFNAFPIDVITLNQQAGQLVPSQPVPLKGADIQKIGKGLIGAIKWGLVDEVTVFIQCFFQAIASPHVAAALKPLGAARFHTYWVDIVGNGDLNRIRYYLGNVMLYHTIPTLLAALVGNDQVLTVPGFIEQVMALPEVQAHFAQTPSNRINYYETALLYAAVLDSAYSHQTIQALQKQGNIDLKDILVCSQVGDYPMYVADRIVEALGVPKPRTIYAENAQGYAHSTRPIRSDELRRTFASSTWAGLAVPAGSTSVRPQNLIEKIVQRHTLGLEPGQRVHSGDFVAIKPHHVLTHDNTGAVMKKFQSIGATRFHDPQQPVFALDHDVQNKSDANLTKYRNIEAFARQHGVDFFPAGRGIGHQIMVEEGYAFPNTLTVASDSHSNMYGGIGCLGTPIVRTDAAAIWATGQTWWQIPPVVQVQLQGQLPAGVTGKDIIVALCGLFSQDQVLNTTIEFGGSGVAQLSVEDRLAIANMTTEWGALAGVFPVDRVTEAWLNTRIEKVQSVSRYLNPNLTNEQLAQTPFVHPRVNHTTVDAVVHEPLAADPGASYAKTLTLDLTTLCPHVSGPNSVKVATALPDLEAQHVTIHKAYLVSCVNSRLSDIHQAAQVLRGKQVHPGVEFYVAAASAEVQKEAMASGDWQTLLDAGARELPPGCGPCIGLGAGLLKDGEVGISATNRNFKGRMGSPKSLAYLASPTVVAASAAAGYICGPQAATESNPSRYPSTHPVFGIQDHTTGVTNASNAASATVALVPGFPSTFQGDLIFCPQDNLNTDGIYPGKYTYNDNMTADDMKKVVMENYDPQFTHIARPGDILVGGFNFGTGSSREQAATALLAFGIRLVIAGSFSDIFKRNAINNGLLVLESPALVRQLLQSNDAQATMPLTWRSGLHGRLDVASGNLCLTSSPQATDLVATLRLPLVGKAAQDLVVAGGLESWVKQRMAQPQGSSP